MSVTFDFSGRNVFVAGGTSGINLGIARAFAEAGARVGVGSRNPAKVDAAVTELSRLRPEAQPALGYVFDVRDFDAVTAALNGFAAESGPIDVLVSGAAGNFPAHFSDISLNGFRAVVDIDLIGTFHVMKAAMPLLRRPGGSVINISAPQAQVPMPGQSHVCAAKAGVDMLTRCLAIEWGAEGVRVNAVVPGLIGGTEGMARLAPTPAAMGRVAQSIPLGRVGTPGEVADLCLYLGSAAARYVNGAVLPVDGGWMLRGAPLDIDGLSRRSPYAAFGSF